MANQFEPIRNELKSNNFNEIQDKIGCLLNRLNLRHNNKTGPCINETALNMSNDELENWYDKIYDLLLLSLMLHKYIENKNDIDELISKLKQK